MSSRPDVKPTTISYNDADSKNWGGQTCPAVPM